MRALLGRAISSGEILEMIYLSKGEIISQRKIKIVKLYEDSFQAYCLIRRQYRTFKFQNALSIMHLPYRKGA